METVAYNFHSFLLNLSIYTTSPCRQLSFISSANRISKAKSTTLRLRMAHSHSAQDPVIEQQRVIIPSKHGEKLVGLLHETGSKEIVILCHGFRSRKDYNTMVNLAAALEKEGISVFRFDFAGNGAIVGHSKGGNVVLLYASKYRDIHILVNVSGRYDLNRGIAERLGEDFMQIIKKDGYIDVKNKTGGVEYRVTEESLMERLRTDMHEACLKIDKECRVLTVHGSADEIIPIEDALEFAKIIPNHKLHIVEGANHGYTSHQTELASVVVNFIKTVLEQDKVAPK
ncbi:Alpha/beta-Hydrolases superfamily protein [Theobroma cacao]|uniref:Alpha/beta-Hydrolases superfamily protein n=1 Tax=Theobroma cacao TaxID=3641 RepID=A0A061GMQ0_THECC|nr:Alpha/beta-Hydrolases superfamily protein [Theobroma cacao]